MAWWVLEVLVAILLVAVVLVLGPLIKRFGKTYAGDVFRANPRTGKSYLVLMDGLLAGALWGVVARIWMRLISTHPEFTWSGTLFILQVTALSGVLFGLAFAARRRADGRRSGLAFVLSAISIVPLGIGPGAVWLPGMVFGAFSLPGPRPRWHTRIVLAVVPVLVLQFVGLHGDSDSSVGWVAVVGGVALCAAIIVAGVVLRPLLMVLTVASHAVVVVPLFTGPLVVWRSVLGSLLYLALVAPVSVAYAAVVRRPAAPRETPSAMAVDGALIGKETSHHPTRERRGPACGARCSPGRPVAKRRFCSTPLSYNAAADMRHLDR